MKKSDILLYETTGKRVFLDHQCMTENGIEKDDIFTIKEIIGDFEQLKLYNQYDQSIIINPNQIINESF